MNSIFLRLTFLFIFAIGLISCDKDSNDIGANLVGYDNYEYSKYTGASVVAYTQKTEAVQTNNLTINQLGIYDNKVFGKTIANFACQLNLDVLAPEFFNPTVTSVTLNVPYFSTITSSPSTGRNNYKLDSISGVYTSAKFKLSVFRNGYEIYNTPASNATNPLMNYSNQNSIFDSNKVIGVGRLNNSTDVSQNDQFMFSASEIADNSGTSTVYSKPAMNLILDNSFATDIFSLPAINLAQNFDFNRAYKGLYFKVEQISGVDGCMAYMDFSKGKVTINYKDKTSASTAVIIDKTITLSMTGNTVNLFENLSSGTFYESLPIKSPNATTTGDKQLYLKGGEGAVAYIDLFGKDLYGADGVSGTRNFIPDELDILKQKGWLINEANLVFNIDQTANGMGPEGLEPSRIYLYNEENKTFLADYLNDSNTPSSLINNSKQIFGGLIQKTSKAAKGTSYKIRITDYVRGLMSGSQKNVRLGLCVNQNIANLLFVRNKSALSTNDTFFPNSSIMHQLGTVLYGTNYVPTDADYAKRLKLEIWYTNPN